MSDISRGLVSSPHRIYLCIQEGRILANWEGWAALWVLGVGGNQGQEQQPQPHWVRHEWGHCCQVDSVLGSYAHDMRILDYHCPLINSAINCWCVTRKSQEWARNSVHWITGSEPIVLTGNLCYKRIQEMASNLVHAPALGLNPP